MLDPMKRHVLGKRLAAILLIGGFAIIARTAQAQRTRPANKKPPNKTQADQIEVYKSVGGVKLTMHIFKPAGHKPTQRRPAIVFFFGGGWNGGSTRQFVQHCRYLASRGMVAMAADYRVYSRHRAKVIDCVADAKSAIRWVRANADRLGVDPDRIAAGGGSAGGHLAAAVGTLDGFDEAGEDTSISARPNALILFNPALDLTAEAFGKTFSKQRYAGLAARWGTEPENISPARHVKKGVPPTILFHGKKDSTVPYAQAEQFAKAMKQAGNRCELVGFENEGHGFFNYGLKGNEFFIATVRKADRFLASLSFLEGEPTIDDFVSKAQ